LSGQHSPEKRLKKKQIKRGVQKGQTTDGAKADALGI